MSILRKVCWPKFYAYVFGKSMWKWKDKKNRLGYVLPRGFTEEFQSIDVCVCLWKCAKIFDCTRCDLLADRLVHRYVKSTFLCAIAGSVCQDMAFWHLPRIRAREFKSQPGKDAAFRWKSVCVLVAKTADHKSGKLNWQLQIFQKARSKKTPIFRLYIVCASNGVRINCSKGGSRGALIWTTLPTLGKHVTRWKRIYFIRRLFLLKLSSKQVSLA